MYPISRPALLGSALTSGSSSGGYNVVITPCAIWSTLIPGGSGGVTRVPRVARGAQPAPRADLVRSAGAARSCYEVRGGFVDNQSQTRRASARSTEASSTREALI